ncbi:hypothetical protein B9G79_18095 [Bdellovibrio bacteriovorus]|uniref:Uncharacterized protein n=2 Tax=Bdellovibrio bacteriovorus TaxID=959 RepID=A0A1Z3ND10_BDEBC|nr:hypothetical protein B9G79_18095 [Bdellovibrio bacteriovorus]
MVPSPLASQTQPRSSSLVSAFSRTASASAAGPDPAIGVAACMGFTLPENFRYPYGATGFSDFWRRWHITLSAWLRDYLYIPIGGNRKGPVRTYINLMITMLLGGLWHGANWTFVVWGALHGLYLSIERFIQGMKPNAGLQNAQVAGVSMRLGFVKALFVFFLVNVTWVFFRAPDFTSAWQLLTAMFTQNSKGEIVLSTLQVISVSVIIVGMVLCHWRMRNTSVLATAGKLPSWLLGLVWAILLILLILSQESSGSFIYFQF